MMKTNVERLEGDTLRLDVEVPAELLQSAVDQVLEYMGRDMKIAGFRPGKVPKQAVLARIGREAAIGEAVRTFLDQWYSNAVVASGIRPVGDPSVDFPETTPQPGEPYAFSVTVECVPKPSLPALADVKVDRPKLPELNQYVDQVLEATLKAAGELRPTSAPATDGDEVTVDFTCTVEGETIRGASAVGYQAKIGDGRLLEELESAIRGQEEGKSIEIPVDFPDDHPMPQLAGKHATFQLELREVMKLELPELSDEVAARVSEFSTAAELRADLEDGVRSRLTSEIDGIFRGNAVAALADAAEIVEPAQLLERRQQELYAGLTQQLAQHGMTIETYLGRTGQDQNELLESLAESARDDLRRELVLLALAEEVGIQVGEADLRAEVEEHAQHSGDSPEEAWNRIETSGRMEMLAGELLIQKTIDHLVAGVTAVEVDPPAPAEEADEASEGDASSDG